MLIATAVAKPNPEVGTEDRLTIQNLRDQPAASSMNEHTTRRTTPPATLRRVGPLVPLDGAGMVTACAAASEGRREKDDARFRRKSDPGPGRRKTKIGVRIARTMVPRLSSCTLSLQALEVEPGGSPSCFICSMGNASTTEIATAQASNRKGCLDDSSATTASNPAPIQLQNIAVSSTTVLNDFRLWIAHYRFAKPTAAV